MKMGKFGFAALALTAAFGLTACGDDSSSSPSDSGDDTVVYKTKEDLPKDCKKGDAAQVGKTKYRCNADSEWIEDNADEGSNSEGDENQTTLSEGSLPNGLVIIGHQVWAGQNLNVKEDKDGNSIGRCYKDKESYCETYGRLYTWTESMQVSSEYAEATVEPGVVKKNHQGICPDGFHIPTGNDWENLVNYVNSAKAAADYRTKNDMSDDADVAGTLLRSTTYDANDVKVWSDAEGSVPAVDAFGMMLVGSGYGRSYEDCQYDEEKEEEVCTIKWEYNNLNEDATYFTTSDEDNTADMFYFTWDAAHHYTGWSYKSERSFPVRCIMNMTAEEYVKTDEYKGLDIEINIKK